FHRDGRRGYSPPSTPPRSCVSRIVANARRRIADSSPTSYTRPASPAGGWEDDERPLAALLTPNAHPLHAARASTARGDVRGGRLGVGPRAADRDARVSSHPAVRRARA